MSQCKNCNGNSTLCASFQQNLFAIMGVTAKNLKCNPKILAAYFLELSNWILKEEFPLPFERAFMLKDHIDTITLLDEKQEKEVKNAFTEAINKASRDTQ